MEKHLVIHIGEKPYLYSECNKLFCTNYELKKHMAFHTSKNHISAGIVVSHSLKIVIFLDACWYILGRNLSCAVIVIKHSQKREDWQITQLYILERNNFIRVSVINYLLEIVNQNITWKIYVWFTLVQKILIKLSCPKCNLEQGMGESR